MKRILTAELDGISPPCAMLRDIVEEIPLERRNIQPRAGGGAYVTDEYRASLRVRLLFVLPEPDPAKRQEQLDELAQWCRGSVLTVSTRPDRFLQVRCTRWPRAEHADTWTGLVEVVFTAWEIPWWQHAQPQELTLTGRDGVGYLNVRGTAARTVVDVTAENHSGTTCQTLAIGCGGLVLRFGLLGLADGETLHITHDANDLLQLTIEGGGETRSAFPARTQSSDDDLIVPCGSQSTAAVYASTPLTVHFSARGRDV